ncbi:MAG: hypothetical protein P4L51_00015 [Puia sp.]|nr:hypothetical protein [Puia sp.]
MEFTGAKGITLFAAIAVIACGVGFGSGFFIGRQFPAHRYERFGNSTYLLDSATGRVCNLDLLPGLKEATSNPGAQAEPSDFLKSLNPSAYPPPCGR